jgi:hypothetical protein
MIARITSLLTNAPFPRRMHFCVLFLSMASSSAAQLNPSLPPGSNFDLSAWKLQTISTSNAFTEVFSAALASGYTSNLFYTNATDGSMIFKVPSNGATTANTSYPRCELRQMTNGANWPLTDPATHYLTAQCKVLVVAQAKPQIIIGQIHGSQTNSELLKLRWTGYQPGQCYIEARFQKNDSTGAEFGVTLASGLSLGSLVSYTITMTGGKIIATVNGGSGSQTYTTAYYGMTDAYYFKAGNYLQYNSLDSTIYGMTQFYKLSLTPASLVGQEAVEKSSGYLLLHNYPNPFNPSTKIKFSVPQTAFASVKIFDTSGRCIASLFEGVIAANALQSGTFNAVGLSSGLYVARLESAGKSQVRKLLLMK